MFIRIVIGIILGFVVGAIVMRDSRDKSLYGDTSGAYWVSFLVKSGIRYAIANTFVKGVPTRPVGSLSTVQAVAKPLSSSYHISLIRELITNASEKCHLAVQT